MSVVVLVFVAFGTVLVLALVVVAARSRRRSRPTVRRSPEDIAAAQHARNQIADARIDAEREKGRQWY